MSCRLLQLVRQGARAGARLSVSISPEVLGHAAPMAADASLLGNQISKLCAATTATQHLSSGGWAQQQSLFANAAGQRHDRWHAPQSARMSMLAGLSPGHRKHRKRRARGGGDKQAGRGHNGQKSRSGGGHIHGLRHCAALLRSFSTESTQHHITG